MTRPRVAASDYNLLPHNVKAEETVIGALLADPDALPRVQEVSLKPTDFHVVKYGWVLEAAERLQTRGDPVDLLSVSTEMENQFDFEGSELDRFGGITELTRLVTEVVSYGNVAYYAQLVVDAARRRKVIAAGALIASEAQANTGPVAEMYDKVSQTLFESMDRVDARTHMQGGEDALRAYRENQAARKALLDRDPNALLRTHWADVDARIGDFQAGQLVIIGACTSVGKTMAMEQIAEANAQYGHKIVYYHLELSHQNMLDRCIARHSGIDTRSLRRGTLTPAVERAMESIRNWHRNITFVHCPGWSSERIAADITRMHASGQCEIAIVDYLQKMYAPELRGYNSAQVIGAKVDALKNVAERLAIPVVLGSQVNRQAVGTHRPTFENLRDSGEIAEKANIVLMLHNPTPAGERDDRHETELVEVYIDKCTDGPHGMVRLVHVKGRFLLGDYVDAKAPRKARPEPEPMFTDEELEREEIPF